MNILLINHYAGNPQLGMEFRPYYLAKEWIKQGHKVLIVGATYSHLRKIQPKKGVDAYDGVDYFWLKTNHYPKNGVLRFLSMILFVLGLFYKSRLLCRFKPDAVIASSTYPFDIYPARYIAKKSKAKLVYEIHDLWPLSPMVVGQMSKHHPFIVMTQMAENYAYKHCDRCVSILPCVHDHVNAHGLDLEKLDLVPNGVNIEDWNIEKDLDSSLQKKIITLKEDGNFLIAFTGSHEIGNALQTPIDAINILKHEKVILLLVGSGHNKSSLIAYVKRKQVNNVIFIDSIQKSSIPGFLSLMDVLYIGMVKDELFQYGISPNKLFDYMMSGKPIIQSIEAGNDLIKTAQCGLTVLPEDPQAVAEAIMELKTIAPSLLQEMGKRGKNYVIQHHTYEILAKQFISALTRQ